MPASGSRSRIMYIERKAGSLTGTARIGRVTYSKTLKTLYYRGLEFRSLKGGYKANYGEVASGEEYWISGPRSPAATRSTRASSRSMTTSGRRTGW